MKRDRFARGVRTRKMKMVAHQNIGEELDVGKAEMVRETGRESARSRPRRGRLSRGRFRGW